MSLTYPNFNYILLSVPVNCLTFEGDSGDAYPGKFLLMSEGLACTDSGARTPINMSGNSPIIAVKYGSVGRNFG